MTTTTRQTVRESARQHGWAEIDGPNGMYCDPVEYRRRTGRTTEVLRVIYDVYGRVVHANWSPSLNGFGGGSVGKYDRDKARWVLDHIETRKAGA